MILFDDALLRNRRTVKVYSVLIYTETYFVAGISLKRYFLTVAP